VVEDDHPGHARALILCSLVLVPAVRVFAGLSEARCFSG
jgi:hypothetical protein